MMLELFALLTAIAVIMIIIGFFTDTMVFATIGFFFLFLLSFNLIGNGLQHETSIIVTEVNSTSTSVESQYTTYADSTKTLGIYLAIGSSAGMVLCFLQKKKSFW